MKEKGVRTDTVDGVNTDNILHVALAAREFAVLRRARHVVAAPEKIISVLAVVRDADRVEARFEAELVSADERVPVHDLCQVVPV